MPRLTSTYCYAILIVRKNIRNGYFMKELTFEQAVAKLEETVKRMDAGDLPLDEALKLFSEGAALTERCQALLKNAELAVAKLQSNNAGEVDEVVFEVEGDA